MPCPFGIQTPDVKRYDWTPKTYQKHGNLRRSLEALGIMILSVDKMATNC